MAILISKDGKKCELPYYEIEQKCIEIINNLDEETKNNFDKYKQDYHYFTPYFDFCIFKLGYMIENPMGYNNSLLVSKDDKIYILKNINYEKYQFGNVEYSKWEFFIKCDDVSLNIHKLDKKYDLYPNDFEKFENAIIDRNNYSISIVNMKFHQNLATLVVNQLIIKNKEIYDLFNSYNAIVTREINFLEDKLGYIRLGILDFIIYPCYRLSLISKSQKEWLLELEKKNYIDKLKGDKDTSEQIERESFKPKK